MRLRRPPLSRRPSRRPPPHHEASTTAPAEEAPTPRSGRGSAARTAGRSAGPPAAGGDKAPGASGADAGSRADAGPPGGSGGPARATATPRGPRAAGRVGGGPGRVRGGPRGRRARHVRAGGEGARGRARGARRTASTSTRRTPTGSRPRVSPARPRRSWSGRGVWRLRGRGCSAQVAALEKALADARTPVAVVIESDGLTEVAVSRVGRLGTLTRRTVDLRPGEYTVTGSRRGYRDVRRRFTVSAGRRPCPPSSCAARRPCDRRPRRGRGDGHGSLDPTDFPVALGGPGSVVPVAGSGGPLAWLGLADGEVFVQPSPGATVVCNGTRLVRLALAARRRHPAPRAHASRGRPSSGRPPARRLRPGRGEPHRAARRPRPASARRAPVALGRTDGHGDPAGSATPPGARPRRHGRAAPSGGGRWLSPSCCSPRAPWPSSCRALAAVDVAIDPEPDTVALRGRWPVAAPRRARRGVARARTRSSPRRTATAASRPRSR